MATKEKTQKTPEQSQEPAALNPWATGAVPTPPATPTEPTPPEEIPPVATEPEAPSAAPPQSDAGEATSPLPDEAPVSEPAEGYVTVLVPHDYRLTIDYAVGPMVIKAGVQEMKVEYAEHWFSKANGVTIYRKTEPLS